MQSLQGITNCTISAQNNGFSQPEGMIKLIAILLALIFCQFSAQAASVRASDGYDVYGSHGVLQIHGSLTASACRLATRSAWQDVAMGNIGSGELKNIGDQGKPVRAELQLEDCLPSHTGIRDLTTGETVWSDTQPAVSVSFQAVQDADNPELVKVNGAKGLALRITDPSGHSIRLGGHGVPLLLVPGQNQLNYIIIPERTREPLRPGGWWSLLNIGLDYQ